MKGFRRKGKEDKDKGNELEAKADVPIIASARTGLAGKDDSVMRRVPADYVGKSVRDALNYITDQEASDEEVPLVESLKRELRESGSVVVINGKTAKLDDKVEDYVVEKSHKLPDGSEKPYRELDIEVSAVQQGGSLYTLLR